LAPDLQPSSCCCRRRCTRSLSQCGRCSRSSGLLLPLIAAAVTACIAPGSGAPALILPRAAALVSAACRHCRIWRRHCCTGFNMATALPLPLLLPCGPGRSGLQRRWPVGPRCHTRRRSGLAALPGARLGIALVTIGVAVAAAVGPLLMLASASPALLPLSWTSAEGGRKR
jgi:hypothetical protein